MISYINGTISSIEDNDSLTKVISIQNEILGISAIVSIFSEIELNENSWIYLYHQLDMHSGSSKYYWFKSIEERSLFLSLKTNVDKIPWKICLVLSSFPKETLEWLFCWQIKISGLWPKVLEKVKEYFLTKQPKIKENYLIDSNRKEEIKNLLISLGWKSDKIESFINSIDIRDMNNSEILKQFFN